MSPPVSKGGQGWAVAIFLAADEGGGKPGRRSHRHDGSKIVLKTMPVVIYMRDSNPVREGFSNGMGNVRNRLESMIAESLHSVAGYKDLKAELSIELDIPRISDHGDYASNIALGLTRHLKRNPRQIASEIVANLNDSDSILEKVEIAGPGFINFFIKPAAWYGIIREVLDNAKKYGRLEIQRGPKVQVEFVSANPTGPLHIGHGRGAAIGDVLANILAARGFQVQREYYINDAGNQMDTLGRSLYFRYRQELGEGLEFPDNHYRGEYMLDLAKDFKRSHGDSFRKTPLEEALPVFTDYAAERILDGIKEDLDIFGVHFDNWFSERDLHKIDSIAKTIEYFRERGFIYESEGAVWFKSTAFGDEKDRVVVRANGASTYFAADLAYHRDKFERGFESVVDIWGADHHGYVERMLAGVQAMGRTRDDLRIVLVQLVNLLRGGAPVAMSTRGGEFVTLREVIDEVGKDATRFIFLTRRTDSPLDFDLEVAKARSNDNPVFYVQYAHARLCSVFEVARDRGVEFDPGSVNDEAFRLLNLRQELDLIKQVGEFPEMVCECVRSLEPHYIPYYLHQLVSLFHSYYHDNRILTEDAELTQARLCLAWTIKEVIGNALELLGVTAPQKM
ncbi:Arginine--tRNA ligase [Syntrophobacter sp. SbD1]|nr:Arginine--tRNA ligase [Syntrophobacter sp. SbD1]